ncbi:PKD domain-containing protein [Pedobacter cryophilus]|uniref:PKD domain-containing protein n=1 Tax=Pedobacter cryophilus TaxID=2571271 RepID=A0A4V5NWX9_9SPHI|nr:PKD domain-containing protein [Pedobacter cryophilus]TKB96790.1 PKD domain-containing protein [Pedobacter cryophilus]
MKKNCLFFIFFLMVTLFSVNEGFASKTATVFSVSDSIIYIGQSCIGKNGFKKLEIITPKIGDTYKWFKNNLVITGQTASSYTATTIGEYFVEVKSGTQTTSSNRVTVTEEPQLIANFTFIDGVCSNIPIKFTNSSTDTDLSYLWDFGDTNSGSNTSNSENPNHIFIGTTGNGNQNFIVKLTITNNEGCNSVITKTITTKQLPDLTLGGNIENFEGSAYFVKCTTDPSLFSFSNQSLTKLDNTNYQIKWGDGSEDYNSNTFSSIITHTYPVGIKTLTYVVTGKNGCVDSVKYKVFVGGNPAVGIGNPGNTSVCTGGTLEFPITGTSGNPEGTLYKIKVNDQTPEITLTHPLLLNSNGDYIFKHTFNKTSCGVASNNGSTNFNNSFSVSVIATNPCGSSGGSVVPIYVSQKPKSNFTISPKKTICINTEVTLVNTSLTSNNVSTTGQCTTGKSVWKISPSNGWTIVSGNLGDDFNSNDPSLWDNASNVIKIKFNTSIKYEISLISGNNNCGIDIKKDTICVNPTPTAAFDLDKTTGCGPLTVKATNNSNTPLCGNNDYTWNVTYTDSQGCAGTSNFTYLNNTNANSANPEFQFNNAGDYSISLTTKNSDGTCSATSPPQTVRVKAKPVISTFTVPSSVCVGANASFNVVAKNCYSSTLATYLWTFTGANTTTSTVSNPANISYPTAGTYAVKLEVTNECGTTTQTKSITVNPIPIMQSVSDKTLCRGVNSGIISFANVGNVSGVTYTWTRTTGNIGLTQTPGTSTSIANFVAANTGNTVLTSTFTVTPTLNGCAGTPITFKISVNPSSPTATAGDSQTLCNQTSVTLAGNNPGTFLGKWIETSGKTGYTIVDDTKFNTQVTGLTVSQNYIFKWTIDGIAPCPATSDTVSVFNRPEITIANAGADGIVCDYTASPLANNSYLLKGNSNDTRSFETGTWTIISKPSSNNNPTFSNINSKNATISGLIAGEYELKWTITNDANCTKSEDNVKITVYPKPIGGTITGSNSVCIGSNVTLTSTGVTGEIIAWQSSPNNSTWTDIINSKKATIIDSNLTSTKYYRVKVASTGIDCSNLVYSAVKTVTVDPLTVGGTANGTQTYCSSTNNGLLSLSGSTGNVVRWEKSSDNVNFTSITNSATSTYSYNNVINTTFFRAILKSGTCNEIASTSVKITINPNAVAANAGTNQQLCNVSETTLSGNDPLGALGKWTLISSQSGITFDDDTKFNTKIFGLQNGQIYDLKWTISGLAPCGSTSATVKITVNPSSIGGTSSGATTTCVGNNSGPLSLIGETGLVTEWQSSTNQINWTSIPNSASKTYTSGNLNETTYFRAIVKSGVCDTASSSITKITIIPAVEVSNAGANQSFCNYTGSITLDGNSSVNGVGRWTQVSGPSISFIDAADPKTKVNISQIGAYVFQWEISNSVCPPSKSTVSIINYAPVINKINDAATYCFGQQFTVTGDTPTGGNLSYTYKWEESTDNTNWQPVIGAVSKDLTFTAQQTVYLRRVVTSGPCEEKSNAILITVLPAIANNTISQNQEICIGKPIEKLLGSTPTGGNNIYNFIWESSSDNINWVVINGATAPDYQPLNLLTDTYFRRTVTSAECFNTQKSISNEVKIIIYPNAIADFTANSVSACIPFNLKNVITSTPYPDKNSSYEWFANGVSIGTGIIFPGYTITTDGETVVIKLVAQSKFGCNNDSKEISFTTVKNVVASFTKDQQKGCGPLTVNFKNTSLPLNGGNYEWNFGNGTTSNLAQPNAIVFQPHPLSRDTTYIITLKAKTDCGETIFTDSVTVRPKPVAVFSPNITIGCSPLTVNFSNQSKGFPNTYTFDFGNGEKIVKTDNSSFDYTFLTTKTDTFTVKLYAQNECGIDSSFYDIVVYPNTIKPELVINGSSSYGCAPFSVKFFNNSEGANSFLWDFNDGSTATSSEVPGFMLHTFKKPGTYVIKLTASNGCSTAITTETVVVYDQPTVSFKSDKLQYCVGNEVIFTNSSPSNFTFIWDFGDGFTSNEISPKHAYKQSGDFLVKLTAIQTYPDGTICSVSGTQTVSILNQPIATFSTNANVLNCAPFTLKVNATPANASGGVEWYFGDEGSLNNITQGYSSSHTFTKPGLYIVKSIAYNQTGCIDSTKQFITITESPIAEFTTADTLICGPSGKLSFSNKTTYSGLGLVSYKWYINNTLISNQKDLDYTFNTPSNVILPYIYEVKLVALTTIGCPDTVKHTIQFNPLPKAQFVLSKTIDCSPFIAKTTNQSTFADQFKWYLDNVLVSTEREPSSLLLSIPNKSYTLKLVAANIYGCKIDSLERVISTHPKPVAIFTVNDSISCNGKLDLKTLNKSIGASSYVWNFGDATPESNSASPTHTYGIPGTYVLRLIASNGFCKDTSFVNINIAPVTKAAFIANKTQGCTQIEVAFENLSVNANSYLWDFGDGSFSSSKNPIHTFNYQNSPFSVKLITYGLYGCSDTTVKVNYITITAPPKSDFEVLPDSIIKIPDYTFAFKNKSTGTPVKFIWDFGNGKKSTEENPSYTYADTGSYKVQLIVFNKENCADTISKNLRINGVPGYLFIPNAFEPGSEKQELRTFKVKGSGIAEYAIKIFNKWGVMIWESTLLDEDGIPTESWDGSMMGQPAPQGVYIWNVYAKFIDGSEWKGMKYNTGTKIRTGPIHLIR